MSLEALLADLKKEYLAGLPARMSEIDGYWKSGRPEKLQDEFHKLKGTGKTYGVADLSLIGEIGERICRDRPNQVPHAMPLLLALITAVHHAATHHETFDLPKDPRFSDLQKLI